MSTKFFQMMIVEWALPFLGHGQICVPLHLYEETVKKSFSYFCQNVLKANGWNLQCMIKGVNFLVTIKILFP